MAKDKCGIYQITCGPTGRAYVGSSVQIYVRWAQHRRALRADKHHAPILQRAWNRHGEAAFYFIVLEECPRSSLVEREQHYVDLLRPKFNTLLNVDRGLVELNRARFALITHCPKGHLYDDANTMIHQGKRVCRKCNAERVSAIYASETPEEREKRRERAAIQAAREKDRAQRAAYAASHKPEKSAYDRQRRERLAGRPMGVPTGQRTHCPAGHAYTPENIYFNKADGGSRLCKTCVLEWQKRKRLAETPEEREARLQKKREWYAAKAADPEWRSRRRHELKGAP